MAVALTINWKTCGWRPRLKTNGTLKAMHQYSGVKGLSYEGSRDRWIGQVIVNGSFSAKVKTP